MHAGLEVGDAPRTRAVRAVDVRHDGRGHAASTQIEWHDDAWEDSQRPNGQTFYERGIGQITNGREIGGRPSALYLSTNIPASGVELGWEGAGWVEVAYGVSGNVESFTVHGQCAAAPSSFTTVTRLPTVRSMRWLVRSTGWARTTHGITGSPSRVDRRQSGRERQEHWEREHDTGRFDAPEAEG